ncbi:MAG: diphosphomevalonate decarboxylase [Chloroflexi bacterium]|jgi:diphosphomevalonate decarboxylase|nr:diphosphomevalonate decarboxylase [Chloroflexota bacterium]
MYKTLVTLPRATAIAGSNIAFVKYWGNLDDTLNVPMNGSISMTLDAAHTITTVEFHPDLPADELTINGQPADWAAVKRASAHLDRIRDLARKYWSARIISTNSFPTGAGIASSASGFAALTLAATKVLGLNLSKSELSRIARLGSGSASRSIDGGFVEWQPGGRHEDSHATPLAPANHWDLVDIIAIISTEHKKVGSSMGHSLAHTSPFYQARLGTVQVMLQSVRRAIKEKNFTAFGKLIEEEAISLHVSAMSSRPSVLYWQPGTVALMQALRRWRDDGGPVGYFTMDAGPNVHVIAQRKHAAALQEKILNVQGVQDTLFCGIGSAARIIDSDLHPFGYGDSHVASLGKDTQNRLPTR